MISVKNDNIKHKLRASLLHPRMVCKHVADNYTFELASRLLCTCELRRRFCYWHCPVNLRYDAMVDSYGDGMRESIIADTCLLRKDCECFGGSPRVKGTVECVNWDDVLDAEDGG